MIIAFTPPSTGLGPTALGATPQQIMQSIRAQLPGVQAVTVNQSSPGSDDGTSSFPTTAATSWLPSWWKTGALVAAAVGVGALIILRKPTERSASAGVSGRGLRGPFEDAKAEQAVINREVDAASDALQTFPRGPTGLPPEAVRVTPEYQAANARFKKAFARLRAFNGPFVKKFAKELRAERAAKYR